MADPRVETDGVTFCAVSLRRRGHVLLDELELTIEPGEILAVMGPSGAGKSTLLRTIAGLDPPSEGVIRRAPGRVAVVFQDPRLLPWRTALENVELVLAPGARPRARDWLARVGLAEAASVYPGALSGGMRQRVAIARALACETPIVLVDEPFANVDATTAEHLREDLVAELRRERRTAVWVTHDDREAAAVADRMLVMAGPPTGAWRVESPSLHDLGRS